MDGVDVEQSEKLLLPEFRDKLLTAVRNDVFQKAEAGEPP